MLCSGRSAFRFIGTCLHLIHRNTCSGKRMTVRLHFHTRTPTSSKKDFRRRTLLLYYYLALSVNISKNASFLFLPSGLTESGCKSTNFILTNKTFQELFTQNKAIFRVFWQKMPFLCSFRSLFYAFWYERKHRTVRPHNRHYITNPLRESLRCSMTLQRSWRRLIRFRCFHLTQIGH